MKCQLAALCEAANVSAAGQINILGEFDTINAAQVPVVWPLMVFVAKLKAGAADAGRHTVSLRVVDEDMQLVAPPLEAEVGIAEPPIPGVESGWPLILRIGNAHFQSVGTYLFQLRVDGTVLCELPLHVRQTQAGGQP